ncbi:Glycosyl transferase family 2 [Frankineae bacterium MT45]|nr:Glycosyl transferase family 2 [Frankineae bacterium MT45]
MSQLTSLSLFFPVYNEVALLEQTTTDAAKAIAQIGISDFEIILVDDGSSDGSSELADRLADEVAGVRVVHHTVNGGYGAALRTGFTSATKEWVLFTDSDGQFDVGDLARFLPSTDKFDVVLGFREGRKDHFGRKVNAKLWALVVRMVLNVGVKDLDCAFKLIRNSALQDIMPLESDGAVISAELLCKLKRADHPFAQVGVQHFERTAGEATGASLKVIAKAFVELVALRVKIHRVERVKRSASKVSK